jgi:hypothetical protein
MKKLFFKISIFVLPFVVLFFIAMLFPLPKENYNLAIIDKNKLLAETKSPKLVLAGGSNLAFGIDSEEIQKSLHIPVVNMGVHAGFGLGRILDDVTPFLKTGDILVISPEYSLFCGGWDGDADAFILIFDAGFLEYKQDRLLFSQYYGFPKNIGYYIKTKVLNLKSNITDIFYSKDILNTSDSDGYVHVYSRYAFNNYGDVVRHLNQNQSDFDSAGRINEIDKKALIHLNAYSEKISAIGVHILMTCPCYEAASFDNSIDIIYKLYTDLDNLKNISVISTPDKYRFSREYFYDTPYHLNKSGREIRTRTLINDIEKWINTPVKEIK